MNINKKTNIIVLTGLMMALVMVMTFIIRIPVPATQGYIHLGDTMIFFSVLLLGWKYGAIAAGVGSMMADLLAGYANYAPATLIIKTLMAVVIGLFIQAAINKGFTGTKLKLMELLGMVIAGLVMCAGYYITESIMYGSYITPLAAIPMNVVQFATGIVLAYTLAAALYKTPVGKIFKYNISNYQ